MFTLVGLMEFFYREAPSGMRSLATSFSYLALSMGYFLSSVFVTVVEAVTGRKAIGEGWLYGRDFNKNHVDRFYWFLAVLSCANFGVYVLCAKWYKYRGDVGSEEGEEGEGGKLDQNEIRQVWLRERKLRCSGIRPNDHPIKTEIKDYEELAVSIMSIVDRLVHKTNEKIESKTDILKEILNPVVAEAEEVSWPPRDPEALILMEKVASCEVMFYECLPDV
ncbi:uncharacterized protein A4U43_C07F11890 [Asparagus officinalis]|uniref:Uncharacterized protein n=1 Tax=Asparagus officinalis TaxID=4686 RepID=A0A5P1EB87_ASPOF|nr:uncharacterized protein A4U43_C07F11890 [Asparagus officinalis]